MTNTGNPPCPGTSLHDLGNPRAPDRVRGRLCFRGNKNKMTPDPPHRAGSMMKTTKQDSKRESNTTIELAFMRLLLAVLKTALLIVATVVTAQAEPRHHLTERNRNYILRWQEVFPGLGTPTTRLTYGKREIDSYRNGLMFERDHVVGVTKR